MIEDKHTNKQAEKQSYFRKAMALTGCSFMVDSPRSHAVCTWCSHGGRMDDRSGTIPEKREPWGRYSLSDRKFTEITELVTKVILHFRTLFVTHGFPLYLFLERSQRSRTAAGETQQLRETRQYSRRKIPGSWALNDGRFLDYDTLTASSHILIALQGDFLCVFYDQGFQYLFPQAAWITKFSFL